MYPLLYATDWSDEYRSTLGFLYSLIATLLFAQFDGKQSLKALRNFYVQIGDSYIQAFDEDRIAEWNSRFAGPYPGINIFGTSPSAPPPAAPLPEPQPITTQLAPDNHEDNMQIVEVNHGITVAGVKRKREVKSGGDEAQERSRKRIRLDLEQE